MAGASCASRLICIAGGKRSSELKKGLSVASQAADGTTSMCDSGMIVLVEAFARSRLVREDDVDWAKGIS